MSSLLPVGGIARRLALTLLLGVVSSAGAIAGGPPPELELRPVGTEFLVGESILATVVVRNPTPVTIALPLAQPERRIWFEIEGATGTTVVTSSVESDTVRVPGRPASLVVPAGKARAFEALMLDGNRTRLAPGDFCARVVYAATAAPWGPGQVASAWVPARVQQPRRVEDVTALAIIDADRVQFTAGNLTETIERLAPGNRYSSFRDFCWLRWCFDPKWSPDARAQYCGQCHQRSAAFEARWPDSPFLPRLHVGRARCILEAGHREDARRFVAKYLDDPERYPYEVMELEELGLTE